MAVVRLAVLQLDQHRVVDRRSQQGQRENHCWACAVGGGGAVFNEISRGVQYGVTRACHTLLLYIMGAYLTTAEGSAAQKVNLVFQSLELDPSIPHKIRPWGRRRLNFHCWGALEVEVELESTP
jgi:hypothetical protein